MDLYTRRVLEEKTRKDGKSFLFYYLPFPYSSSGRARAHVRPNNIINFHGFLVITIIKFPRRIAARFIGELLRGELTSVVGRDGTGYRSPGAANWKQYRACLSDVERVENRETTRGFHERKCSFPRRNENFGRLQVFCEALDLGNVTGWSHSCSKIA